MKMEDDMKKSTDAQIRAAVKYNKKNVKQFKLDLNVTTDADIIAFLETIPNKRKYVNDLIRADMAKKKATD